MVFQWGENHPPGKVMTESAGYLFPAISKGVCVRGGGWFHQVSELILLLAKARWVFLAIYFLSRVSAAFTEITTPRTTESYAKDRVRWLPRFLRFLYPEPPEVVLTRKMDAVLVTTSWPGVPREFLLSYEAMALPASFLPAWALPHPSGDRLLKKIQAVFPVFCLAILPWEWDQQDPTLSPQSVSFLANSDGFLWTPSLLQSSK